MIQYLSAVWELSLEAAPWLLLGLIIGGLFKSLVPQAFLQRHLTRPGMSSVIKAAVLGMPLPLCSCGVIPAAMGLRQAGASKPATSSFLVATPETGVDSISVTYAMMGPVMAIIRPVAALISAIVTGLLVLLFGDDQTQTVASRSDNNCCAADEKPNDIKPAQSWFEKARSGVWYALTDLYQSILKWLIVGILLAALIEAFVPHDWLIQWGDSWVVMILMLFVGIPMYVCATGSTPIAASFLMAGISPGAVLVFLLAGPATNMATLGVIRDHMGSRTMWLYLAGIISCALLLGLLVNVFFSGTQISISTEHAHNILPGWVEVLSVLVLLLLALLPFWPSKQPTTTGCCGSKES
ncbi:SO_0444 family Cu/Zn efflux transporter [Marinicella sediminis]|nr:SO_0444 family Cu/Zn efflux transporter [Marinicella sediminis]